MAAALVVSCVSEQKGEAAKDNGAAERATVDAKLEEMGVTKPTDEPATSGDIVYVDMAYLTISSKLTLVEGAVLEDKYKAYAWGSFWLSDTINEESKFSDSAYFRICTWGCYQIIGTEKIHFDDLEEVKEALKLC